MDLVLFSSKVMAPLRLIHLNNGHIEYALKHNKSFQYLDSQRRGFTTESKIRRLTWHKQTTVKARAAALQESFYPTKDILYSAAEKRINNLLGLFDRASILNYLGRPQTNIENEVDQLVSYGSGAKVSKKHRFMRKLPAKQGYIEKLGLGYVYVVNGDWWVHWNHSEQTTLISNQSEGNSSKASVENFSLSNIAKADSETTETQAPVETTEKRESESKGERNSASESIPLSQLNPLERAILRVANTRNKEPGG
jgi:hypothetical protein